MIKVYFRDSRSMPEVAPESIQAAIISTTEVLFMNPNGQPILGLTQEFIDNISKVQSETGIFFEPFNLWNCYKDMVNEIIRSLKPDGFLILNVGTPHGNSDIYRLAKYFRGVQTLYPYIAADVWLENTSLHLIHDLIVSYKNERRDIAPSLTVENYVEHFFIYSKQRKKHLTLKSVLNVSARKIIMNQPFKYFFHSDVIKYLITKLSQKGDWLLDPLSGSGTFGAVAEKLGRNTVLYEIETNLKPLMVETLKDCEVEWHEY